MRSSINRSECVNERTCAAPSFRDGMHSESIKCGAGLLAYASTPHQSGPHTPLQGPKPLCRVRWCHQDTAINQIKASFVQPACDAATHRRAPAAARHPESAAPEVSPASIGDGSARLSPESLSSAMAAHLGARAAFSSMPDVPNRPRSSRSTSSIGTPCRLSMTSEW